MDTNQKFVDKNVDQLSYIEAVKKIVIPFITKVYGAPENERFKKFQQDGAPAHKALKTQQFLEKNVKKFIPANEWPGNSFDLNPIELVWALLDDYLLGENYKTVLGFKRKVSQGWEELSISSIVKCINHSVKRVKQIADANGGWEKISKSFVTKK